MLNHYQSIKGDISMDNIDQIKTQATEQYDKLASKFNELYFKGKARGYESMEVALEKANEQLTAIGEFSVERGEELKKYLSRDLDQTISAAHHFGEEAKDKLNPSRLSAGALASLANVLELSTNALQKLTAKTKEQITYSTGEVASAGSFTCQSCEQKLNLKASGHIPPCPKCHATHFTKGY
jgi:isocitrate dehydrogenase